MPWLELRFVCDAGDADAFSDALMLNGALSVSVEDADAGTAEERPIFAEPGTFSASTWPHNAVIALLDPGTDPATISRDAARSAGLGIAPPYSSREVEDQDWVRLTQSQFEPIQISGRLWIVPTWHIAPDPDAIVIRLDPGMAFGTGSHPTTRLCLQWLDAFLRPRQSVIDYGCGSGILAIAAARLGAGTVTATDIDPQALAATRANSQANTCLMSVEDIGAIAGQRADVVVANILTNPLKVLAGTLAGHVDPGGWLVLSGILESQAHEVIATYAPYARLTEYARAEGWVCLAGRPG